MAQNADEAVNLLALDGGGIRGVSELLILHEVMRRIQHDLNLANIPRPCDYFHLIGGTSTGGLIALMLGRLQMTTDEALRNYNTLACAIFSKNNRKWLGQDGAFKATTVENKVQELVSEKGLGELMLDPSNHSGKGKAFVCAVPANNMEHLRRFRTYPIRELASANCKIWEAARATTAAPTFFKRIAIGEEGQAKEEFIDGGLGCNNPANQVLEEAGNIFGNDRLVRCLVSIGTGHPGTIGLAKPDAFQRVLPTKLIAVLKKIATDCEITANSLSARFKDIEKFYFRFNVAHGAEGISLEEWEKMGQLTEHTKAYMADVSVSKAIDEVVDILCNPRNARVRLGSICGIPRILEPQPMQMRLKPRPSPIFTGRKNIIKALEVFFSVRPHGSMPRREYLLYGLGGAGKTQIALKFAQEYQDRFERIFWIDASSRLTIEQSYKGIAAENNLGDASKGEQTESALRWLSNSNQEWLLLFDNYESTENLDGLVPGSDRGNILYTSRDPALSLTLPPNAVSKVTEMEREDAITLLLRAARLEQREMDEGLRQLAKPIVEILGFLSLAIDIAGASIRMGRCHLDDYIDTFRNHREEMMKDSTFKGASRYNQAVYTAWDISYDAVKGLAKGKEGSMRCQDAKAGLQILNLFAFFHNEGVMEEIFKRAAESRRLSDNPKAQYSFDYCAELSELLKLDADGIWDPFLFRKGLSILLSFSLVTQDESRRYFSMHVLVHSWARDHMPSSARPYQLCAATALLSSSISWRFLAEDYAFRRQLLPHIRVCKKHSDAKEATQSDDLDDASNFSLVLYEGGHWWEAEELEVQVMETRKRVLGQEHPSTLTSMANLASTYRNQGRWKEAEELEVQVMETRKRVLGQEHPSTLTSMANLASTYRNQGRWKEAEELEVQVMETRKRVLGQEHPSTLTSMANLASTYRNQGRWKEAEELEVQVMETRKRVLGQEHPSTLTSMANLASTYRNQGRWKEAEELQRQELETCSRVLGPEHPSTLTSIANLASTYRNQGRWKEAEELEVQVMETSLRVLGQEHPSTLTSMANLASTFWNQGRWKEAEELEVQVMETRKRVLGQEHPSTLTSMANLASTYRNQGRWKEAEELEVQVMETRKRVLGQEHPSTLTSMANLASTYRNQGRWKEAEELEVQVMETRKRVLGQEHPSTLTSMANLASTFWNQGRWKEAEELEVQVMETRKRVLGQEHPSTLTSMANLASTYRNQGRWKEAEELQRQELETCSRVLGPEHPDTLISMENLALIWNCQGSSEQAVELMTKCVQLRIKILGANHPHTVSSISILAEWEVDSSLLES